MLKFKTAEQSNVWKGEWGQLSTLSLNDTKNNEVEEEQETAMKTKVAKIDFILASFRELGFQHDNLSNKNDFSS